MTIFWVRPGSLRARPFSKGPSQMGGCTLFNQHFRGFRCQRGGKINGCQTYTNHPFRREYDLPSTSMIWVSLQNFRGEFSVHQIVGRFIHRSDRSGKGAALRRSYVPHWLHLGWISSTAGAAVKGAGGLRYFGGTPGPKSMEIFWKLP